MENTDASLLARLQAYMESIAMQADLNIEDFRTIHDLMFDAADALRRSGEALRRLQEDIEALERYSEQGAYDGRYVKLSDVLEILSRQSGAEGTEAGGRSQPLAPIEKGNDL